MRALFLFPSTERSVGRYFTHVRLWEKHCGSATVSAFQRESNDQYLERVNISLGVVRHGNLLKRIPVYRQAISSLSALIDRHEVLVVYTLDNFLLAWMAKIAAKSNIKIILFMLDIRQLFVGNKLKNHVIQSVLIFAFERSSLVLVSSRHYMEEYVASYVRKLPMRWLEIENKVNADEIRPIEFSSQEYRDQDNQIVIGYFGILRCERSLQILIAATEKAAGSLKVIVSGEYLGLQHMAEKVSAAPWIDFQGSYSNPEDLPGIYGRCDVVWACYPYEVGAGNQEWAKTNRFYEAGYFGKPAIASKGTRDAEFISAAGNGEVVDLADVDGTVARLISLGFEDLNRWQSALAAVPEGTFEYTNEFAEVYSILGKNQLKQ